jgi:hypothetical protein
VCGGSQDADSLSSVRAADEAGVVACELEQLLLLMLSDFL